ncbi:SDR family NAD(P)-dependent oxidoreductase [Streptomyces sp. WMMC500]|uniref:SDR family NAD(P)-dependent oxidoreductase n=1 Tax=Streptomyces sp. WMMC500 TaxID=3015154 RepID=UPI00248CE833|nr:SDR family NAD(P)-dependent oxidoreductase [Streptomyces sp. WMMC500]WBB57789.1 SDR family NAD(P)-dependent oxidoreductase [Streptomyces sp. WMMC500]
MTTTVVMTGGTSGFGALAAERIAAAGDVRLLLGARRAAAAPRTGTSPDAGSAPGTAADPGSAADTEPVPLDLAELASVRAFATAVRERLGGARIDALVLNAGLIRPDADGRTADGFETTFAVNHLAHYLLLRLLLPDLADGAFVSLTTSGTHDPATGASLALPRHADAALLAHPDRDPGRDPRARRAGEHAYTAAKLCAVLTARALAARPEAGDRGLTVLAYDPGQVFGTGLMRDKSAPLRLAWAVLGTPVGAPLRRFGRNLNSRTGAGRCLADLALKRTTPPRGRTYAALRRDRLGWPDPSAAARSDTLAESLWADSAGLVGLPE